MIEYSLTNGAKKALVAKRSAVPKQVSSWVLLKRMFRGYIKKHAGKLILAAIAMAVVAATTATYARIMEPLVDQVFVERNARGLILVPLALVAIAVTKGIAGYSQAYIMGIFGQRIIADVQNTLFSRLIHSDIAFFQSAPTGSLISNFLNDANLLREALTKAITGIVKDSLTLVFLIVVLFLTDWQLALVATIGFPISIIPLRSIGKRMRKASTKNQERTSEFSAILNEAFSGARHIKAYGTEGLESQRIEEANERRLTTMFRVIRTRATATPLVEILGGIAVAIVVIYAAGIGETSARLTAGQFITFITALGLAYQPLRSIANLNTALQEGLAAAQRIFALMDRQPEINDKLNAPQLVIKTGTINFENVTYIYDEAGAAISKISFEAKAGQRVAIVGPSGAGKSTILSLIPRFYDATAGRILIDGQDITEVTQKSLRSAIALVSQDSVLFHDSIRANIAYGKPTATHEEIASAAQAAAAWEFINELPSGLDTVVGQSGMKLSGGQRQRISIARAILKDAPILLLDEATSSLDTQAERQVQEALNRLASGRTTIVVAHRLSTVADADLIILLENGEMTDVGKHNELLARGGLYGRLFTQDNPTESKLHNV